MKDERQQASRDLLEWKIIAVAVIAAWLTVTFTDVVRQIPMPGFVTAVALAIVYWQFVRRLVWVYLGYRRRIAKIAAQRAAARSQPQATTSGKET
jgi:hypothetical protein